MLAASVMGYVYTVCVYSFGVFFDRYNTFEGRGGGGRGGKEGFLLANNQA